MKTNPADSVFFPRKGTCENRRILVVDDNESIHADFRKILGANALEGEWEAEEVEFFGNVMAKRDPRFELEFAFQGEEAVQLVKASRKEDRRYAMAFLDVRMPPGCDGLETAVKLWEIDPDIQIVICTAYSDYSWSEMVEMVVCPERLLVLKKPFDLVEVLQFAHALTEKWSLLQAARRNTELLERQMSDAVTAKEQFEAKYLQIQRTESIGTLAGGVAHDFNNLLTVISGYLAILSGDLRPADPKREYIEEIRKATEKAGLLTAQLLAFARYRKVQPRALDLNSVVDDVTKMLRRLIGEDIRLVINRGNDLCLVNADPVQMGQVLMNLALNARHAMPEGGVLTIKTENISYYEQTGGVDSGNYVLIEVSDTGSGMTGEIKSQLFEPFFTTKPPGQGTGLGLPTCLSIVKQSGGRIDVESEPGNGAIFRLYLPRAKEDDLRVVATAELPEASRGKETILIVEDDFAVGKITASALQHLGYTVFEAPGGVEAIEIAGSKIESLDLLLCDVVMPEVSGPDLMVRIRTRFPNIKVLFMSGYPIHSLWDQFANDGRVALLAKPFTPKELARQVRLLLDERGNAGE